MTTLLRTDLDDFLFAPIADDATGMPLNMLTTLARLGVDPWTEAAGLAALSREAATQKLIALLAGVPNGLSPGTDAETAASRLVALLHPSPKPLVPAAVAKLSRVAEATEPGRVKLVLYFLLALVLAFAAQWVLTR